MIVGEPWGGRGGGGGGGMDIFWNHTFPDVIMVLLFYPIAYLFLPGKRQSTHIYGYTYR